MTLNVICPNRPRGHFLRQIIFIPSIKLFNWAGDTGDTRHVAAERGTRLVVTSQWLRTVGTIIRIQPTTIYISTINNAATTTASKLYSLNTQHLATSHTNIYYFVKHLLNTHYG